MKDQTTETYLPSGLITDDVCVIEEQPDHIVVAVRLPKRTIAANLHLLAYLADSTNRQSLMRPDAVRMHRLMPINYRHAFWTTVAVIALFGVSWFWFSPPMPPR